MSIQTIAMDVRGVTFDSQEITEEGIKTLKEQPDKLGDLFDAMFVTDNGDYSEIIDDSEEDEIDPSKIAIEMVAVEADYIEVNIKLEFSFSTLQKLTTESLLAWEEENDMLAFGLSLSINSEFLEDEDEFCAHEGYAEIHVSVLG